MRTSTLALAFVGLSQAFGAVMPPSGSDGSGKRAVACGEAKDSLLTTRDFLVRRTSYSEDEADDLDEEAEGASEDNLRSALDKMKSFFEGAGIAYALQGGFALKLQGNADRTTEDLDISVDVSPGDFATALEGTDDSIKYHEQVRLQLGGGGTKIYVDGDGHTVLVDALLASGPLGSGHVAEADTVDGYKVLKVSALFETKLKALEQRDDEKDYNDLVWLYENKADDIRDSVGDFDEDLRENFYEWYTDNEDDEDKQKALAEFLGIEV